MGEGDEFGRPALFILLLSTVANIDRIARREYPDLHHSYALPYSALARATDVLDFSDHRGWDICRYIIACSPATPVEGNVAAANLSNLLSGLILSLVQRGADLTPYLD